MKKVFIILFTAAVCLSSCKKEKTSAQPVSAATLTTATATITTDPFSSYVSCNGFLSSSVYIRAYKTNPFTIIEAQASFNISPEIQPNANFLRVDTVNLNGDSLIAVKDAFQNPMYYWQTIPDANSAQNWKVKGANGIPSFDFSYTEAAPSADFSKIPDSLRIGNPVITINNVSNFTTASISISAYGVGGNYFSFNLHEGSNTIHISKGQINTFYPGAIQLFISLENYTYKTFEGKNFRFSKRLSYENKIVLKP